MISLHPANTDFHWVDRPHDGLRRLTADQVQQFDEQGYVLVRDAFSAVEIAALRDDIDAWESRTTEFLRTQPNASMSIATADEITFTIHLVLRSEAARAFAQHPALAGVCHDIIGSDSRLYWDQAVYKKPELQREFPWHQDNGYNYVEPQQYLTCWIPLTDATIDNGCPWVMPGLHRRGTLAHWTTPVGYKCLDDSSGAVAVEAPVGSIVVFSSLTPHRTGPNVTDATRKAYIVQYAPDGAEVVDAKTGRRTRQDDPARQFIVDRRDTPRA